MNSNGMTKSRVHLAEHVAECRWHPWEDDTANPDTWGGSHAYPETARYCISNEHGMQADS